MGYLLDTNIVSDFVRYRQRAVARRIRERGEADVLTSIVVAAELRFDATKRGVPRLARRIDEVLARLAVLPLDEPADRIYAELRARLERQGQPLGANDLLVAATALADDHPLVTADQAFVRIAELPCENWLDAAGGADSEWRAGSSESSISQDLIAEDTTTPRPWCIPVRPIRLPDRPI
jgi:tRNA(fMet)-specific endonuclease VapC